MKKLSLILVYSLLCALSVAEATAEELSFKLTMYQLNMESHDRLEINVVSCVPPSERGQMDAPPSSLAVECRFSRSRSNGAAKDLYHIANLSPTDESSLEKYTYNEGIRLFSGLIDSDRSKGSWQVVFFEPGTTRRIGEIDFTKDEYNQLISAIQKAVVLQEAFKENWEVLTNRWLKSHVIVNKAGASQPEK